MPNSRAGGGHSGAEALAKHPRDPTGLLSLQKIVVQAEIEARIKADGDLLLDHECVQCVIDVAPSGAGAAWALR